MTAGEVYTALVAAHAPPEWAIFCDVANSTGTTASRRADAIALNLWPSRGLEVRGFEIKVSRSDLARELKQPEKADAIARYCNTWWIAAPAGLVKPEELPLAWGLMEVTDKGAARTKRAATPQDDVTKPTRAFMAAIARAAHYEIEQMRKTHIPRAEIEDRIDQARRNGEAMAPRHTERVIHDLQQRIDGAAHVLAVLGIDVNATDWETKVTLERGVRLARALKVGWAIIGDYDGGGLDNLMRSLENAKRCVQEISASLKPVTVVIDRATKEQPGLLLDSPDSGDASAEEIFADGFESGDTSAWK